MGFNFRMRASATLKAWLAAACFSACLSAPASADTIVTFSVDNVSFLFFPNSGPVTGLPASQMSGSFDWDQTTNAVSPHFSLINPDPLVWSADSYGVLTEMFPQRATFHFGDHANSFVGLGHESRIWLVFRYDLNGNFAPGQTFNLDEVDGIIPSGFVEVCGAATCNFSGPATSTSFLTVTAVTSVPEPSTWA